MAGIYIHIPFCKQKCSYCNFHFSTQLQITHLMIDAIVREIDLRKGEIQEPVETIYFGGGTPSILPISSLERILNAIYKSFHVIQNPEITIETNPDDLDFNKIKQISQTPINRFSMGVQSFYEEDLRLMNRAHNANQSIDSIKLVQDAGFENITIDLIYGAPTTSNEMWLNNLKTAIELQIPHISSYALTVEPKTILEHQIETHKVQNVDENRQEKQFKMLVETLQAHGFIHYEISNFGKEGFFSQHNSNYWKGKSYLGVGPSAHSFDGNQRSWNIANNSIYVKKLQQNQLANEIEVLSEKDKFNELVMIGLRTIYGLNLSDLVANFPPEFVTEFQQEIQAHLDNQTVKFENGIYTLTPKGKFLADGIAASLFRI